MKKYLSSFPVALMILAGLIKPSSLLAASCDNMLNFPGFNSYVDCGPATILNPESGLTVEAWIYTLDPSFNQKIAGNIDPFTNSGYELAIDSNKLYCEIKDTSGVLTFFRAGQINANEWTHVAFTYLVNGSMKGFINGVEVISVPVSSTPIGNTGTTNFIIGSAPWDQNYFNFNGNIDEVKVYNSQLTIHKIRQEMRMSYSGFVPGLIGYWTFAEGSGTITSDLSGHNNDGTLNGITLPSWIPSDGPYGTGFSEIQVINCCNQFNFDPLNLRLDVNISTLSGTDTLVVSYINCDPGGIFPTGSADYVHGYWVLDKYGSPGIFNGTFNFTLGAGNISTLDEATPSNLKLYIRNPNSIDAWTIWSSASTASSSTGAVQFSAASLNQQLMIGTTGNSTLQTESINSDPDISLYPNPAKNYLNIHLNNTTGAVQLNLLNSLGQEVYKSNSTHSSTQDLIINVAELKAGLYTLKVESQNGISTKKILLY